MALLLLQAEPAPPLDFFVPRLVVGSQPVGQDRMGVVE